MDEISRVTQCDYTSVTSEPAVTWGTRFHMSHTVLECAEASTQGYETSGMSGLLIPASIPGSPVYFFLVENYSIICAD